MIWPFKRKKKAAPPFKLPHRDDIPMEVVEELIAAIQEHAESMGLPPGQKVTVKFAGDHSDLPPEVLEGMEELNAAFRKSQEEGLCFDCGAQMPDYPGIEKPKGWKQAEGWRILRSICNDGADHWQCPNCDQAELAEGPVPKPVRPFGCDCE